MTRFDHDPFDITTPSLGTLLTELRLARGWSQLRVAEQLCAASGVPTVSRHEVSRWERQQRVPGEFWLGWLAAVLDVSIADLTTAAATTRATIGLAEARSGSDTGPGETSGMTRIRQELLASAHAWLTDPNDPLMEPPVPPARRLMEPPVPPARRLTTSPPAATPASGTTPGPGPELPLDATGLARLRRLDDLVGGRDLLPSPA
ncbi:helix-turn-helix domain-containing protein, partial [Plantactinospora sp. S1510]